MNDELRERLRAADPVPSQVPVDPADDSRTRALMEAAMSTDPNPTTARSRWVPIAIAAGVAAVLVGGALTAGPMLRDEAPVASAPLALTLPGDEAIMASCAELTAEFLGEMPVAFAGTAAAVTDSSVSLDVDRWYRGGDAATVELSTPPDISIALLGGAIDFTEGARYLITATGGTVNLCGFSGAATPELERIYERAFPGD